MAAKTTLRCRRISEITDELTDKAIGFYDEGKLDKFWTAIDALNLLLEVEGGVCELE